MDLQWCPLTVAPRYPVLQESAGSPQLKVSTARIDQARGKCQISRCLLSIESFLNSLWAVPFNYLDPCFVLLKWMSQIEYYLQKTATEAWRFCNGSWNMISLFPWTVFLFCSSQVPFQYIYIFLFLLRAKCKILILSRSKIKPSGNDSGKQSHSLT